MAKMKVEPDFKSIEREKPPESASTELMQADDDETLLIAHKRKEIVQNWFSYTTSHGVGNLYRASNPFLRLFWFLCYLGSISYCCYQIINVVVIYMKYSVLIRLDVVESSPIEFPAVTICNLNPFDKTTARAYIDRTLERNNLSYTRNISLLNINPREIEQLLKSTIADDRNLTRAARAHLGFSMEQMIITCSFSGTVCSASDFELVFDYDYGNCFTFNGDAGNVRKINEAGSDSSFRLELFLGDDHTQNDLISNSGAHFVIHGQLVAPLILSEGRDAPTGYQTNIGIKKSITTKMSTPHSFCIEDAYSSASYDSFFYKAVFERLNMKSYRQQMCMRLCLQKHVLDSCACVDGSLPNIYEADEAGVCATLASLACVKQSKRSYFTNASLVADCKQACPLECLSVQYQVTSSSSRYPTLSYNIYLSQKTNLLSKFVNTVNVSENAITKSILSLNFFYDDLTITYINEVPEITIDMLIGNIGGNLALFAGMSVLSFAEILELLIELLALQAKLRACACGSIVAAWLTSKFRETARQNSSKQLVKEPKSAPVQDSTLI